MDVLRAALRAPKPDQQGFSVKAVFREDDRTEYLWLTHVAIEGDGFRGTIDNVATLVTNVRFGQTVRVGVDDIQDWSYSDGGRRIGGWSIAILAKRKRMSELPEVLPKCERQDTDGMCYRLGEMYRKGEQVEQDLEVAHLLTTASCSGGNASACNTAGWDALLGRGAPKDGARAAQLFDRSCPTGEETPAACDSRAFSLLMGIGGKPRDIDTAVSLFAKACPRGIPHSCIALRLLHLGGHATPPSFGTPNDSQPGACGVSAEEMATDCAGGEVQACVLGGMMLEKGLSWREPKTS